MESIFTFDIDQCVENDVARALAPAVPPLTAALAGA